MRDIRRQKANGVGRVNDLDTSITSDLSIGVVWASVLQWICPGNGPDLFLYRNDHVILYRDQECQLLSEFWGWEC